MSYCEDDWHLVPDGAVEVKGCLNVLWRMALRLEESHRTLVSGQSAPSSLEYYAP